MQGRAKSWSGSYDGGTASGISDVLTAAVGGRFTELFDGRDAYLGPLGSTPRTSRIGRTAGRQGSSFALHSGFLSLVCALVAVST
ncbi:hypothetical protein ABMA10_18815 [Plantibacter sp. RU18]